MLTASFQISNLNHQWFGRVEFDFKWCYVSKWSVHVKGLINIFHYNFVKWFLSLYSTWNSGSPISIASCVVEAISKTQDHVFWVCAGKLCVGSSIAWVSCSLSHDMPAPNISAIVHSHWGQYHHHWYEIFHLNIPSLPLPLHQLPIHPSKHARRFSNLTTDHKGMVFLSPQCLMCRCTRPLHSRYLVH